MEQERMAEVSLDLSGFRSRVPSGLLRWQLMQAGVAPCVIAVSDALAVARWQAALRQCGGEVVAVRGDGERRLYTLRPAATLTEERLDMRGARCPFPVIEARRRLRRLSPQAMLRLTTDCTAAAREINTWTARNPQVALLGSWLEHGVEQVFLLANQPAQGEHRGWC